jgi:transcriptional regulator with XRE-family HTH domain
MGLKRFLAFFMDAIAAVARNLRRLRVRKQISQEALAVDASIDRTYVSRLERGMENPTVAVLERLASALGVEIAEFFVAPRPEDGPIAPLPSGRRPKTK